MTKNKEKARRKALLVYAKVLRSWVRTYRGRAILDYDHREFMDGHDEVTGLESQGRFDADLLACAQTAESLAYEGRKV